MIKRPAAFPIALAIACLGMAACSPAEQEQTEARADAAGDKAENTGSALKEEASQVGSAIAAGASEAAQEVDEATDSLARKADAQKAETASDTQGNATPD
jgi:hypothetical protein